MRSNAKKLTLNSRLTLRKSTLTKLRYHWLRHAKKRQRLMRDLSNSKKTPPNPTITHHIEERF